MRITRCICTDHSFASLLDEAAEHGLTWSQLCQRTTAGQHCGRCLPYLERAAQTGQTVFTELLPPPAKAVEHA